MRTLDQRTPARWWYGDLGEGKVEREDWSVGLEVEHDESGPGRIAIHTYYEGTGSHSSYYLDREAAIELAAAILLNVRQS